VERAKKGLPALKANGSFQEWQDTNPRTWLTKAIFPHFPTYGSPFKMMEDFGIKFTAAGENIAMGQQQPEML